MKLIEDIPSRLQILRYPCRVWYCGQPQLGHICDKPNHIASACPLHDLCHKCHKPGHFARDCVNSPEEPPTAGPHDPPAPPATDASSQPVADAHSSTNDASSDSSEPMHEGELASGDEEVLANAQPQTGSPRCTRSSTACAVSPIPDSMPVSQPSFPPSRVPASVPDVPSSDPALPPVPVRNTEAGFFPPKFSGPFPVRDVPADLRDHLPASHSARSVVVNEDFVSLDGSSTMTSHLIFDFGIFTAAVFQDKVTFESVREDLYVSCRASKSASCLSLPVCSVMPGVDICIDLPPRPSYVTPFCFPGLIDLPEVASRFMDAVCMAFVDTELDPLTFTVDDIKKLLTPDFASFSECEQKKILDALCRAEVRDGLKEAMINRTVLTFSFRTVLNCNFVFSSVIYLVCADPLQGSGRRGSTRRQSWGASHV